MTKQPITQSQKRFQDSLGSLFRPNDLKPCDFVFLKSSSDVGVQRNGGRNGARLAPQSFISYLKKLNIKPSLQNKYFSEFEVSIPEEELEDFHVAQQKEAHRIGVVIEAHPKSNLVHLGGGHDHIYPLLKALSLTYKKIIVLNVDAHADTRTDEHFHSGTPFRQFSEEYLGDFMLIQLGLLEFANSASTMSPLTKGESHIIWRHELINTDKIKTIISEVEKRIDQNTAVIFSLDADALNAADMPGVSAVNGHGLTREELNQLWLMYRELPLVHKPIMGIYELNPVYDTLSMTSMRTLGTFVYECF